jgi:hypothetical protein
LTPEPYPLTNAYWKVERAKLHLHDLTQAVNAFCLDSHVVTAIEEPEHDRVRYRVQLKQPHVYIYLIFGDLLQCLRTALDQAVWSLIYRYNRTDSEGSEFPIFGSRPTDRKSFERKTKGLPAGAVAYVESIQPYNHLPVSEYPLWQLHELNRIDKHRRISVRPQLAFAEHGGEAEETVYGFDITLCGPSKGQPPKIVPFVVFGEKTDGIPLDLDGVNRICSFVADEVLVRLAGFAK